MLGMLNVKLREFQRRFVREALRPEIDTAALSIPRGNGKSFLAAHLLERALTPGDKLHVEGAEYLLCAASIEQARIVFRFVRANIEGSNEYRFIDSTTRIGITHKKSNTKLRVLSSNGRTAFGIVNCPLLIADEGGSWETVGGGLLHDAIETAKGKPGSPLRAVYIGTLAPSKSGWWNDLIDGGTYGSTYVMALQGDVSKWDSWHEIRRVNPLANIDAGFRKRLLLERDAARRDSRLKARFLSYRLNVPTQDESQMLLTTDDWANMTARPVPEREGAPIVGIDIGAGRAWSAATALYRNGRVEALALAPGIPSIADQERRDRVPAGLYQRLVDSGLLSVAHGLHIQPPAQLWAQVMETWGRPAVVIADRFRMLHLRDVIPPDIRVISRVTQWSDATFDIYSLRRLAKDGPLSVEAASRSLLAASLAAALVQNDTNSNSRLIKSGTNNQGRDDVAAALLVGAGEWARRSSVRVGSPGAVII